MPGKKLVCCLGCGRDTFHRSGICRRCFGGYDVSKLKPSVVDVLQEADDEGPKTTEQEYNGDTERDDL